MSNKISSLERSPLVNIPKKVYNKNPFYNGIYSRKAALFKQNRYNSSRMVDIKNSSLYKTSTFDKNEINKSQGLSNNNIMTSGEDISVDKFMFVWGYAEKWRTRITNLLRPELVSDKERSQLISQLAIKNEKFDPPFTWDALAGTDLKIKGIELAGNGVPQAGTELPGIYINTDNDPKGNPYFERVVIKAYGLHYSSEWISFFITTRPTREMRWTRRTFTSNRAEWRMKSFGTPNDKLTWTSHDLSGELRFFGIAVDVPFDISDPTSAGWRKGNFDGRLMVQVLFQERLEHMLWTITDGQKNVIVEAFINSLPQYDKFVNTFPGRGNNGTMWDYLEKYEHKNIGIFQRSTTPFMDMIENASKLLSTFNPMMKNKQYGEPDWALLVPGHIISKVMRYDKNQLHLFTGSNVLGMKHVLEQPRRSFYQVRDTQIFDVDLYRPPESPDAIQLFQCFKQDVVFNYFPMDRYNGIGFRYDREGVIYVMDGEKGTESPVRLKDYIKCFKKHFKSKRPTIVRKDGIKFDLTLYDFVKHFADDGETAYYKRAIDGMLSEILKRYPKCVEKTLDEIVTTLVRLINNDSIRNFFISPSAIAETLMFQILGNPRSKYAYLWESIRDLIDKVTDIVMGKKSYKIISRGEGPLLSNAEKKKKLTQNNKTEAFKLGMFYSIIGKDAFQKLLEGSALIQKEWYKQIGVQSQMFSFIRWFFTVNLGTGLLERIDQLNDPKEGYFLEDERKGVGIGPAFLHAMGTITDSLYPELLEYVTSSSPSYLNFIKGAFQSVKFGDNCEGLDALIKNNIIMPGQPCFIRTMISAVDSAGYSKKGALELLLGPPRSYILSDVEHGTATFHTEMPCGVAPVDENGYLRIDDVNYEQIKRPLSTRYWNGSNKKEDLRLFKRYEGRIIPFVLKSSEWEKAKNRRVLPINGEWNNKYKKHAINELFCTEACFENEILRDFYNKNKMRHPRRLFAYFRYNERSGLRKTGNRMYQGAQSEFDPVKGIHCISVEQQGPLRDILAYHYRKRVPERVVKFSQ